MGYIPLFLEVTGRRCVVIGSRAAAAGKVRMLSNAGASVVAISAMPEMELAAALTLDGVRHLARRYQSGDLRDAVLAFAESQDPPISDPAIIEQIVAEARERNIPINVIDTPERCSFISPSIITQGRLQIAISTGGASPAVARMLREEFESHLAPGFDLLLEVMEAARRHLRGATRSTTQTTTIARELRARRLTALARSELRARLASGDYAASDALVSHHLGIGLAELGIGPDRLSAPRIVDGAPTCGVSSVSGVSSVK
jgi:precorrin-2 dehydrogenase/sirohydrochlorin ferrochelatase